MDRQAGKYKEARKNWILLVIIHLIVIVMLAIFYYSLSNDIAGFFGWMMIGIIFSLIVNVGAYKINPHWYRNRNNTIAD